MIPILFEIGSIRVYSYGLMLGIGFLLGSYVLSLELRRRKMDPAIASGVTILAVIFGIAGAKILSLVEEWDVFLRYPWKTAFSPSGLTWYGGFILGMVAVYLYIRRKKVPYLRFLDALGVALMIAYGVGRLGCHFSGDGDYGFPTTLPWGTIYAQGIAKPAQALEEYFAGNPGAQTYWHYDSLRVIRAGVDRMGTPYSRFDELTPLHPAPVYELIMSFIGFGILWALRTKPFADGTLFMIYLMLASTFRFLIEFIRLNPRAFLGISEAQLIAAALFLAGLAGTLVLSRKGSVQHGPAG
jgi:phosphatidylglycerol:prolipoprotein diacylglycerol transferase